MGGGVLFGPSSWETASFLVFLTLMLRSILRSRCRGTNMGSSFFNNTPSPLAQKERPRTELSLPSPKSQSWSPASNKTNTKMTVAPGFFLST